MDEQKIETLEDTRSTFSSLSETWIRAIKLLRLTKNDDLNKNELNVRGKKQLTMRNCNDRMQSAIVTSGCEDYTSLLEIDWFEGLNFQLRTNQIAAVSTDKQQVTEMKRWLFRKNRSLFRLDRKVKCVKFRISLGPGEQLMQQKSRPVLLQIQEAKLANVQKLCRKGRKEKQKTIHKLLHSTRSD